MTVIIGIDPGSRITGYGVIIFENNQHHYLDSGYFRLPEKEVHAKLQHLYRGIQQVMQKYAPTEAAVEQIFMHANPSAALKLGQARGAAIVALGLPIAEYSARQVKQSIAGYGAAEKIQVQYMVKQLLCISSSLQADAADALAVALCHAHARFGITAMGGRSLRARRQKPRSWRQFDPATMFAKNANPVED